MKKAERERLCKLFDELDKEAENFFNEAYDFRYYDLSQFSKTRKSIIDEGKEHLEPGEELPKFYKNINLYYDPVTGHTYRCTYEGHPDNKFVYNDIVPAKLRPFLIDVSFRAYYAMKTGLTLVNAYYVSDVLRAIDKYKKLKTCKSKKYDFDKDVTVGRLINYIKKNGMFAEYEKKKILEALDVENSESENKKRRL